MSRDDLRAAVRDLRRSIRRPDGNPISQTEFARLVGKTLNTIQRYETLVPPRGAVLAQLAKVAEENGRDDLSGVFFKALHDELGPLPALNAAFEVGLTFEPSGRDDVRTIRTAENVGAAADMVRAMWRTSATFENPKAGKNDLLSAGRTMRSQLQMLADHLLEKGRKQLDEGDDNEEASQRR